MHVLVFGLGCGYERILLPFGHFCSPLLNGLRLHKCAITLQWYGTKSWPSPPTANLSAHERSQSFEHDLKHASIPTRRHFSPTQAHNKYLSEVNARTHAHKVDFQVVFPVEQNSPSPHARTTYMCQLTPSRDSRPLSPIK